MSFAARFLKTDHSGALCIKGLKEITEKCNLHHATMSMMTLGFHRTQKSKCLENETLILL